MDIKVNYEMISVTVLSLHPWMIFQLIPGIFIYCELRTKTSR